MTDKAQEQAKLDFQSALAVMTTSSEVAAQLATAAAINRQTETYIRLHGAGHAEPMEDLLALKVLLVRLAKAANDFLHDQSASREHVLRGLVNEVRNQE